MTRGYAGVALRASLKIRCLLWRRKGSSPLPGTLVLPGSHDPHRLVEVRVAVMHEVRRGSHVQLERPMRLLVERHLEPCGQLGVEEADQAGAPAADMRPAQCSRVQPTRTPLSAGQLQ